SPPWAGERLSMPSATVAATDRALTRRGFHADCRIIGRLKPGVMREQAKADLDGVAQREAASYPGFNADWTRVALFPLRDEILFNTTTQLVVLVVAVGLVLMIGCVNVANLTLARAGARGRELAIRAALGAGRGRVVRSLWQLRAVNAGFDPQSLVTFYISPPPLRAKDPARLAALYTQVEDAARQLPGVTSVALTNFTPLSAGGLPSPVDIPGRASDPLHDPQVWFMTVSPGYFRTMRIPVRAGREFSEADLAPGSAVVVNEAFARAFWP